MKLRYVFFLLLLLSPITFMGQKRKSRTVIKEPVKSVTERVQEALDHYAFSQAEEILTKEMAALKKKRKPTDQLLQLLQDARKGAGKLHATERVVIIDSITCPAEEVLKVIKLSHESGRLDTYASTYHQPQSLGNTLFENELGNKRYLANDDFRLATADKVGNQWSEPTLLTGLHEEEEADTEASAAADTAYRENYPFLLADGITLYFAATGAESMGGYDIFVTRADGEDGSFLTPENVGFPFNSTANDYLLVIDELNQLGFFVSDRFQPEGQVCIYVFIPNETRQVYGDDISESELQALARLTSIRDSWPKDAADHTVADARLRLTKLRTARPVTAAAAQFTFIVDDSRTYRSPTDFHSPDALKKIFKWQELSKTVVTDAQMLQRMRDSYAKAKAEERQRQTQAILRLEESHAAQIKELQRLTKEIRNAEISHKN